MREIPKRLKTMLREQIGCAWEAEMRAALGALADKFEKWRAGTMSSSDLHDAIHEYHDGVGREIWKRYSTNNPTMPLAHAVAAGFVAKESLPREVQEHIASLVEFFEGQDAIRAEPRRGE